MGDAYEKLCMYMFVKNIAAGVPCYMFNKASVV